MQQCVAHLNGANQAHLHRASFLITEQPKHESKDHRGAKHPLPNLPKWLFIRWAIANFGLSTPAPAPASFFIH